MRVDNVTNKKRAICVQGTRFMVYSLWFIGKETSVAVFIAFTPYTLHSTPYTLQHFQRMIY